MKVDNEFKLDSLIIPLEFSLEFVTSMERTLKHIYSILPDDLVTEDWHDALHFVDAARGTLVALLIKVTRALNGHNALPSCSEPGHE